MVLEQLQKVRASAGYCKQAPAQDVLSTASAQSGAEIVLPASVQAGIAQTLWATSLGPLRTHQISVSFCRCH